MADQIRVWIMKCKGKAYNLQWREPISGKRISRSSKTKNKREARQAAVELEQKLNQSKAIDPDQFTWQDFRQRYSDDHLAGLAAKTNSGAHTAFDSLEREIKPSRLCDVTADALAQYVRLLRKDGLAEETIAKNLRTIKAALNWGRGLGMIEAVPSFPKTRRAKGVSVAKGRPVTGEEFERILAKVASVVGIASEKSWRHLLVGLSLSGLRLGEAFQLSWNDDRKLCVDLSRDYPILRIPAELEKGNTHRLLPIVPDFAEFLLSTPPDERTGYVFNPLSKRLRCRRCGGRLKDQPDQTPQLMRCRMCRIDVEPLRPRVAVVRAGVVVSKIGEAARVKVHSYGKRAGDDEERIKFASAHDLRRSFGFRWSQRVMPPVLKELMRHRSIDTTMRYYVGENAQATASHLWRKHWAEHGEPEQKENAHNPAHNPEPDWRTWLEPSELHNPRPTKA